MSTKSLITVFGATGYTGRRIAKVLDREGLPYRLAGRSTEKLAQLSASLPARPDWITADATQAGSLPSLFQGSRVLINCAGPFTDLGERVIAQAAMSGTNYLDITNELGFVYRASSYGKMAMRNHAALVPACAFEAALADCAAEIISRDLLAQSSLRSDPLNRIDVIYEINGGGSSIGTRRSAVRSLATSWFAYRDGTWTGQIPGERSQRFNLPNGSRHTFLIPSSESILLPLHLRVQRVDVWMAGPPGIRVWAPLMVPLFARLSRSILRPLILKLVSAGGKPDARVVDSNFGQTFTITVFAQQGRQSRWISLSGKDPYTLTAEIVVYAARRLAENCPQTGFLAPSQAFDAKEFLDHARQHWGLVIQEGIMELHK